MFSNLLKKLLGTTKQNENNIETPNKCLNLHLSDWSLTELRKHYNQMFKYASRDYIQALKSDISKKRWSTANDQNVCDICKKNESVGDIPIKAKFPSGHLHPPAGYGCRCIIQQVI